MSGDPRHDRVMLGGALAVVITVSLLILAEQWRALAYAGAFVGFVVLTALGWSGMHRLARRRYLRHVAQDREALLRYLTRGPTRRDHRPTAERGWAGDLPSDLPNPGPDSTDRPGEGH